MSSFLFVSSADEWMDRQLQKKAKKEDKTTAKTSVDWHLAV